MSMLGRFKFEKEGPQRKPGCKADDELDSRRVGRREEHSQRDSNLQSKFFKDKSAEHRYKLLIAYDGTQYGGWQVQPNADTIQQVLEEALLRVCGAKTRVVGSGRTDAGVHALEQVAHCDLEGVLNVGRTVQALNGVLPRDIRILGMESVKEDFHARFSAKGKRYRYHITMGGTHDPFWDLYSLHVFYDLDMDLLRAAVDRFVGTHDFTSFANVGGAAEKNGVRTIYGFEVHKTARGCDLEVHGNGFLYKMVRNMVGMALRVASGKESLEKIDALFEAKDRRMAPMAAAAKGLFLAKVEY